MSLAHAQKTKDPKKLAKAKKRREHAVMVVPTGDGAMVSFFGAL